jgi:alpha-D-xyloside xylohydrolase
MIVGLHADHVKFMISVWCNPHGKMGDDLAKNKLLLGEWINVFNSKGREVRWNHINDTCFKIGTDAWWADCTEPSDDGEGIANQMTALGFGGRVHNAYPLFASQSLYEGQRTTDPNKRVCILTRSAYPGMQRYAAASWSGDINGNWETFQKQIPAGLNFCLTGIPYWTTDCGDFFHPCDQYTSSDYNELLARWFQWSTFCPILRIHGYKTETEIWKWMAATQKILLAYDQFRYRMLSYTYSLAWKVTSEGSTMMRALPMNFPNDPKALTISNEYLFGPAFLVAPVTAALKADAATCKVYLPTGADWVNFWTGEKLAGGQEISTPAPVETLPLFVRAGSIVPLGPVVQYANEKSDMPIELRIYPGSDATFTLYEDEGDSYAYEHGARATIPIHWDEKTQILTFGAQRGQYPGMPTKRSFEVVVVRPGSGTGMETSTKPDASLLYIGTPFQWRR